MKSIKPVGIGINQMRSILENAATVHCRYILL
jgi:hypothetical protein